MVKHYVMAQRKRKNTNTYTKYVYLKSHKQILQAIKYLNCKDKSPQNTIPYTKRQADFNCWNFTAWLKGWTTQVYWSTRAEMEKHLRYLKETTIPSVGDIVAWYDSIQTEDFLYVKLTHTAIIIELAANDNHVVIQKEGKAAISIQRMKNTWYSENAKFKFYTSEI